MRKVLILGAGQSARYLIQHLLERAQELDLELTVADRDGEAAQRAFPSVGGDNEVSAPFSTIGVKFRTTDVGLKIVNVYALDNLDTCRAESRHERFMQGRVLDNRAEVAREM